MADEKQTAVSDIDDWLDDLDDAKEFSGELDQENIDALLGNAPDLGDAEAEPPQETRESEPSAELDQNSIDALLNGNADLGQTASAPAQQTAAPQGDEGKAVELDQDNIDALLSGSLDLNEAETASVKGAPADDTSAGLEQDNIDALLRGNADLEQMTTSGQEGEAASGDDSTGLDQNSIDALLRGSHDLEELGTPSAKAAPPADDIPAGLEQANIDALFANAELEKTETGPGGEAFGGGDESGLDQANIDALLGGQDAAAANDELTAAAGSQEAAPGGDAEAGPDLDLLLGGGNDEPDLTLPAADNAELGQDNIDVLLRGATQNEAAPPAATGSGIKAKETGTVGTLDVDQDEIDQLFAGLDDDLAEPFPQPAAMPAEAGGSLGNPRQVEELMASAGAATAAGDATVAADIDAPGDGGQLPKNTFLPPMPAAFKKMAAAVITVCLVLLAGVAITFFRSGEKKPPAIAPAAPKQAAQVKKVPAAAPPQPPPPANALPVVSDSAYRMAENGGEVAVALTAKDTDNDPLTFTVTTPPQHGRLSGTPPVLTYLPNQDFPGEDRFEYQARDGQGSSGPARVTIIGPNLAARLTADQQKPPAEPKAAKPPQAAVLAGNLTFTTANTGEVPIKWGRIWRAANRTPYNARVSVEISDSPLHGTLSRITADHYCYRPDPAFTGTDVIRYRFRQDGLSSKAGKLTMRVIEGNLAPEIHIRELADAYLVGETVVIDASASRDDARSSLSFNWEQLAGVPVHLKKNNSEGSVVSFAMPSQFYTSADAGPVLRVTVIDAKGKSASRDIKLHSTSRRKSPLWGAPGGRVAGSGRLL